MEGVHRRVNLVVHTQPEIWFTHFEFDDQFTKEGGVRAAPAWKPVVQVHHVIVHPR